MLKLLFSNSFCSCSCGRSDSGTRPTQGERAGDETREKRSKGTRESTFTARLLQSTLGMSSSLELTLFSPVRLT